MHLSRQNAKTILFALALLLPSAGCKRSTSSSGAAPSPAVAVIDVDELKQLQGKWQATRIVFEGREHAGAAHIQIEGTTYSQFEGGKNEETCTITQLNPSSTPKHLDFISEGQAIMLVYELNGDILRLKMIDRGRTRATDLKEPNEKNYTLYEFRRFNAADAANEAADAAIGAFYRGFEWMKKKDSDRALKEFDEAIRLDPKFGGAYFLKSIVHAMNKQSDLAIANLQRAYELGYKGEFWAHEFEFIEKDPRFLELIQKYNKPLATVPATVPIPKKIPQAPTNPDEATAVRMVEKYNGWVTRDDKQPDNPVIGVAIIFARSLTDADLKELKKFKHLSKLSLSGTEVTDAGMKELADLKLLTELGLAGTKVTDAGLRELKNLKQLTLLDIGGTKVTDAGLRELKELKQLTSLHLPHQITNAGLKELKAFKLLTALHLASQVTDAGLKELKDLEQLSTLSLSGMQVTDSGLKELNDLKQLTHLSLNYTSVTGTGLKDLKHLITLDLGNSKTTDAGLKELKQLQQLTRLDLRYTEVTDAGMKELKELKQLTHLNLNVTRVTDAGLKDLRELKQLTELSLHGNGQSYAGVVVLRSALPGLNITGLTGQ